MGARAAEEEFMSLGTGAGVGTTVLLSGTSTIIPEGAMLVSKEVAPRENLVAFPLPLLVPRHAI
jgi:hypothetical protein